MAVFHVIGKSLVAPEEFLNKSISGELEQLSSKSTIDVGNLPAGATASGANAALPAEGFEPIGIGKPLSIEIACVYIGKYRSFLGGKKDVVIVSGIKGLQTFQATSRALNMQSQDVEECSFLKFNAFEDGTPYVYYTPAMDTESMVVSFELMFDNFDGGVLQTVSGLLASAAGIPVFMPAASYLIGGSKLLNIGSTLGDALFSGEPDLTGTIPIQFNSPILPATEPREYVIFNESDRDQFKDLKVAVVNDGGINKVRLVDSSNEPYKGDAPYMIVLLNGKTRPELAHFTPTLASASILKKFYGSQDKTGEFTTVLQDAMQLYNDATYKAKGERVKAEMSKFRKHQKNTSVLKCFMMPIQPTSKQTALN